MIREPLDMSSLLNGRLQLVAIATLRPIATFRQGGAA